MDANEEVRLVADRPDYRNSVDPEDRRWAQKYPRFPGVAECARLIAARKARGTWAEIIVGELARNARECFPKLVQTFQSHSHGDVQFYIMMALEMAALPESVPFLVEVLREDNPAFVPCARRALEAIGTREARKALWAAEHE